MLENFKWFSPQVRRHLSSRSSFIQFGRFLICKSTKVIEKNGEETFAEVKVKEQEEKDTATTDETDFENVKEEALRDAAEATKEPVDEEVVK